MTLPSQNMLKDSIIPVILGDNLSAHLLALKIFFRFGVISYVCDVKRSPLSFIDPCTRHFPLFSKSRGGVVLESLAYLSSSPDYLLLLVCCDEELDAVIEQNRNYIEARFIITDKEALFKDSPLSKLL